MVHGLSIEIGAGEGNRTLVATLAMSNSTIELHLRYIDNYNRHKKKVKRNEILFHMYDVEVKTKDLPL